MCGFRKPYLNRWSEGNGKSSNNLYPDYLQINILYCSIYKAGLMQFEVNRNTTPQFLAGLRTSCSISDCFGSKLTQVGELLPDTYAVIEIAVFEQPTVKFVEKKVIVDLKLMLNVYVEPKSNETLCLVAQVLNLVLGKY